MRRAGVAPGLHGADLLAAVPGLDAAGADLEVHDILRVPGASLTIPDVIALAPAIRERIGAGAAGAVVTQASRTGRPVLARTYSYPGSERDLRGRGLIGAGFLDPLKARILLHLLLAAGAGREQIAAAFGAVGADLRPSGRARAQPPRRPGVIRHRSRRGSLPPAPTCA